jgi:hypothetical protein
VVTGEAESPQLTLQDQAAAQFVSIGSMATVYKSQREAVASWTRGVKAGLAECLAKVMETQAKNEGTKLAISPGKRVTLSRLSPRQAAYRFVGTLTSGQAKVPMYIDIVFVGRGRGLSAVFVGSIAYPLPVSELTGIVGLVSSRLAKAFTKPPSGPTA